MKIKLKFNCKTMQSIQTQDLYVHDYHLSQFEGGGRVAGWLERRI